MGASPEVDLPCREELGVQQAMHVLAVLQGAQAPNAALTLNRVALGVFFGISGYHKLFNASRHAALTRTLQDDGVHGVPIMRWLLPSSEFAGGWALIMGMLSVLAAFGLLVICVGAMRSMPSNGYVHGSHLIAPIGSATCCTSRNRSTASG